MEAHIHGREPKPLLPVLQKKIPYKNGEALVQKIPPKIVSKQIRTFALGKQLSYKTFVF